MKNGYLKNALSLVMAIIMLSLSLNLVGCDRYETHDAETTPEESNEITESSVAEAVTTEEDDGIINNMTIAGAAISKYKIVYYDSDYARACAQRIQKAIRHATGYVLPLRKHSIEEEEYEILVGKTGRAESNSVRSEYDRPNVYYDIVIRGKKLVIMGEGYTVLNKAVDIFEAYISNMTDNDPSINESVASGDIIDIIDAQEISMVNRADGTDLRVFHWNMAAPYLNSSVTPPPVVYNSNVTRGEVMADIILQLLPDIITTNEFYKSHNGDSTFFNAVMKELEEYYVCLESAYDKDKPTAGANAITGKTINSNIIYRRDSGLSVVTSAWRYSTEKTTTSSSNPGGWVYYHGSHTAVFSLNGKKFILSVSHYADSRSSNQWAKEHLEAVADAQAASGSIETLPVILTGDLYTSYSSSSANSGYQYLTAQGYMDSQRCATVNANNNISHGTFHTVGVRQTTRISEDFVWYKNEVQALCFKVLTSQDIDDTSDHYPVMADIKFK